MTRPKVSRRSPAKMVYVATTCFLERAVRRANEEQLLVEFVLADMRTFHRPVCFDAAISLYTTFGYFESEEDESAVLRNLFASLKPGRQLVMELLGKELIARDFRARNWQCSPDGSAFLLEEREVCGGWGFLQNHWLLLSNTRKDYRWTMRLYSGAELESLLRNTGFSSVTLYGGLAGSPYNNEAKRLVAARGAAVTHLLDTNSCVDHLRAVRSSAPTTC